MFSCQYSASPKNPSNNVSPTVYAATCVCINRFAEDNMSVQPQQGGDGGAVRSISQNANSIGYWQLSPDCKKGNKNYMHPKCQVAAYKATEDTITTDLNIVAELTQPFVEWT
ncbi:predicted protein [Histoplasma mississippiense (nom. inval.)]|uniref:predicted protein n=1 Tax=Ajellomyces capsulatus (strain NAm1 / WU24) TaxID=2059318 RepID=UPI000157D4C6|nr:predicted protein [Histoplasma mississippiense (nom. inval.)]EDN05248.1 predicted protein [Histoplasma mississippiense (nom. inval.)]